MILPEGERITTFGQVPPQCNAPDGPGLPEWAVMEFG